MTKIVARIAVVALYFSLLPSSGRHCLGDESVTFMFSFADWPFFESNEERGKLKQFTFLSRLDGANTSMWLTDNGILRCRIDIRQPTITHRDVQFGDTEEVASVIRRPPFNLDGVLLPNGQLRLIGTVEEIDRFLKHYPPR